MSSLAAIVCLVLLCGAAYGGTFPGVPGEVEAYLSLIHI